VKDRLESQSAILRELPKILFHQPDNINIELELGKSEDIWVVAVGKGALRSVSQIVDEYSDHIIDGLVISDQAGFISNKIQIFRGSHPIPDANTVAASYEVLDFISKIPSGDTLVFCVSGGTSSMFTIPPFGIEIEEIQQLYSLLLESGCTIQEMNVVRKHVCDLKGGKLLDDLFHLKVISVIESDVPGDDSSTIGSGPSIPDPSTFVEAVQILKNLEVWENIPISIQEHLICGVEGYIPENPKPGENDHPYHTLKLLSGSTQLKTRISSLLREKGYKPYIIEEPYSGTVQKVAKEICSKAVAILSDKSEYEKPAALIYSGESTVKVKGNGKGGRNQELALMAALSFEGQHTISLLSMDTDGIDGPTDVAGAIVNSNTTLMARKNNLEPERFLSNNDSYEFHKQTGTHIETGPTGINLMDLQVVLID
jgi:glycerate-2-kinase